MNLFKVNNFKISQRLVAGFLALMVLGIALGCVALYSVFMIRSVVTQITDHTMRVLDESLQAKVNVMTIRRDMANLAKVVNSDDMQPLIANISKMDHEVDAHLAIIREVFLGKRGDIDKIGERYQSWRLMRDQSINYLRAKRHDEATQKLVETRAVLEQEIEQRLQDVSEFSRGKGKEFRNAAESEQQQALMRLLGAIIVLLVLSGIISRTITNSITAPLEVLRVRMAALAAGDLSVDVPFREGRTELTAMAQAVQVFKDSALKLEGQRWVKANVARLSMILQSSNTVLSFAQAAISELVPHLGGGAGVFYFWNESTESLDLIGSYGLKKHRHLATSFKIGEGLVGQSALERKPIILTEVPDDFARITSGIGEASPRTIFVAPIISNGKVLAVIEIGSFQAFSDVQQALIDEIIPIFALDLEILARNTRTESLLAETQRQAAELRSSEEELRVQSDQLQITNAELSRKGERLLEQTEELRASEEELRAQREQLRASNSALLDKSEGLEAQAELLGNARAEADKRALERDTASRYKSEFLANMSHELRTPLNSLLILARCLVDNDEGNLSADQVDSARIIHDSGTSLLRLINDILDLSKVEAGKMEVQAGPILLDDFRAALLRRFRMLAESKGLNLSVEIAADLPAAFSSDPGKLEQIINNLLGNAIKFTEQGKVVVRLKRPQEIAHLTGTSLDLHSAIEIEVADSGIGIPADKMDTIFQAFEQADGSSSRRYGGTGLGLTISRRLAQFLGGEIFVVSEQGRGSAFTLILPLARDMAAGKDAQHVGRLASDGAVAPTHVPGPGSAIAAAPESSIPVRMPALFGNRHLDDRDSISPQDETILVIEDDEPFAKIVCDISRKRGFKCLIAGDGVAGLDLARSYRPTGIVLDIGLPKMDGWSVMESLKQHPETRHIPVHFMSATDSSKRGLEMGAVGYLTKPVTKQQIESAFERIRHFATNSRRRLLLVDDDDGTRKAVLALLGKTEVEIVEESNGEAAFARLKNGEHFDCMVLDLGLPGMGGVALLEQCSRERLLVPPVVVYSGSDLSEQDTLALREYTDSIVIKGARSPERLLDEVTLFLHSVQSTLPNEQQQMLRSLEADDVIAGCSVLVVDDDMRNAFALSKALRAKGLKVLMAQDGYKALNQLKEVPDIHMVLMDIMMPGMDGYEAIREIRKQPRFQNLPIIALTAKAMVGDREKCLTAGANDYLSKPVDIDQLIILMREQMKTARIGMADRAA